MAFELETSGNRYPKRTIEIVTEAVKSYASDVRQLFPVVKAYLFGSWVKGTQKEWSDVDVCFFLKDCENKNKEEILLDIYKLTWNYCGMIIEPHVFTADGLNIDHPYIQEILETGIEIYNKLSCYRCIILIK
jgi:DNA polymerase sigma